MDRILSRKDVYILVWKNPLFPKGLSDRLGGWKACAYLSSGSGDADGSRAEGRETKVRIFLRRWIVYGCGCRIHTIRGLLSRK